MKIRVDSPPELPPPVPVPFNLAEFEEGGGRGKTCCFASAPDIMPPVPLNLSHFEKGDGRKKRCCFASAPELTPPVPLGMADIEKGDGRGKTGDHPRKPGVPPRSARNTDNPIRCTRNGAPTDLLRDVESPPANNMSLTAEVRRMSAYFAEREEILIPEAIAVDDEDIPSATVVRPTRNSLTVAGRKIRMRYFLCGVVAMLGATAALTVAFTMNREEGPYSDVSDEIINIDAINATFYPSNVPSASLFPSLVPSSAPSFGPTSILQTNLMDIISKHSGGDKSKTFPSEMQPKQRAALDWLVDDQAKWLQEKEPLSNAEVIERFVLALLYLETRGDEWFAPFGFMTGEHVCRWRGVLFRTFRKGVTSCTHDGRVKNLTLSENNLHGMLPTEIGLLTELTALHIGLNDVNGNLPSALGSLTNITHLELNNNDLSGPIHSLSGLTNLRSVDLSANEMTGSLVEASNLKKLESFVANGNKFSGTVPKSFSNISSLETMHLQWNQLSGNVDFMCKDLPDLRLDCDGDEPEVECMCCVGCTIVNNEACDPEAERSILLNVTTGSAGNGFEWELHGDGSLVAAGGDYDDGERLDVRLCLSFPGDYDLITRSSAIKDEQKKQPGVSFAIDNQSSSIGPWGSFYFALTREGSFEERFVPDLQLRPELPSALVISEPCWGLNFELSLATDAFGDDTSWSVLDKNSGAVVVSEGGFASNRTLLFDVCLFPEGCYDFVIRDAWDDGICCEQGDGSYNVTVDGILVGTGGEFGSSQTIFIGGNCNVSAAEHNAPV